MKRLKYFALAAMAGPAEGYLLNSDAGVPMGQLTFDPLTGDCAADYSAAQYDSTNQASVQWYFDTSHTIKNTDRTRFSYNPILGYCESYIWNGNPVAAKNSFRLMSVCNVCANKHNEYRINNRPRPVNPFPRGSIMGRSGPGRSAGSAAAAQTSNFDTSQLQNLPGFDLVGHQLTGYDDSSFGLSAAEMADFSSFVASESNGEFTLADFAAAGLTVGEGISENQAECDNANENFAYFDSQISRLNQEISEFNDESARCLEPFQEYRDTAQCSNYLIGYHFDGSRCVTKMFSGCFTANDRSYAGKNLFKKSSECREVCENADVDTNSLSQLKADLEDFKNKRQEAISVANQLCPATTVIGARSFSSNQATNQETQADQQLYAQVSQNNLNNQIYIQGQDLAFDQDLFRVYDKNAANDYQINNFITDYQNNPDRLYLFSSGPKLTSDDSRRCLYPRMFEQSGECLNRAIRYTYDYASNSCQKVVGKFGSCQDSYLQAHLFKNLFMKPDLCQQACVLSVSELSARNLADAAKNQPQKTILGAGGDNEEVQSIFARSGPGVNAAGNSQPDEWDVQFKKPQTSIYTADFTEPMDLELAELLKDLFQTQEQISAIKIRNNIQEVNPRCFQPGQQRGSGSRIVIRFSYDPVAKNCVGFPWSGSSGNDNRFNSMNECLSNCQVENTVENLPKALKESLEVLEMNEASMLPRISQLQKIKKCYSKPHENLYQIPQWNCNGRQTIKRAVYQDGRCQEITMYLRCKDHLIQNWFPDLNECRIKCGN